MLLHFEPASCLREKKYKQKELFLKIHFLQEFEKV